jgi:hypothetical protein
MRTRIHVTAAVSVALIATAFILAACGPEKEMWSERPTWVPGETSATAPATATPPADATPVKLFDLGNVYGVTPGAKAPVFTLDNAATVTEIMTYHYIVGGGPTPGTIALKAQDGTLYGPWNTAGLDGQGEVKNAYWDAKPNAQLPAGTYTVIDSDPKTWSTNEKANGLGFVTVLGMYSK